VNDNLTEKVAFVSVVFRTLALIVEKWLPPTTHHAEGRVDPKVDEGKNGFWFWIPQSM
jgi:hypothetical protein